MVILRKAPFFFEIPMQGYLNFWNRREHSYVVFGCIASVESELMAILSAIRLTQHRLKSRIKVNQPYIDKWVMFIRTKQFFLGIGWLS